MCGTPLPEPTTMQTDTEQTATTDDRATSVYSWIMARLDEGMTVYMSTAFRCTMIKPKHRAMIRLKNGRCQIQRGKSWDIITWCQFSAR